MIKTVYEIELFTDKKGKSPFDIWYKKLDNPTKERISEKLYRIKIRNLGDFKNIKNDLFEFRLSFGSGYRIYFSKKSKKIGGIMVKNVKFDDFMIEEFKNDPEFADGYLKHCLKLFREEGDERLLLMAIKPYSNCKRWFSSSR